MANIIYILIQKHSHFIVFIIIFVCTLSSFIFFNKDYEESDNMVIDHFYIFDYKYQNESINYVIKNKKQTYYMYSDTKKLLPIGAICQGNDFEIVKPVQERNFIKRDPIQNSQVSKIDGSIYLNQPLLNCSQGPLTLPMKFNQLKYKYTEKVINSSHYSYIGDILMLSIGNKLYLKSEFFEALQKIGIYHLYVISGTHVAYLSAVLIIILKQFKIPIEYVKVIIIILLTLFLCINIFSPSIFRAVLMAILLIISSFFKQKPYLSIISITAIIQFLFNPYIILHAGFQLSYITTFVILFSRRYYKNKSVILQMIIITAISEISTIVVILMNFNEVSFSGLIINLIFEPIFSFLIFPAVLIYNLALFTYLPTIIDMLLSFIFTMNTKFIMYLSQLIEHRITIHNLKPLKLIFLIVFSYIEIVVILVKRLKIIVLTTILFLSLIFLSSFNIKDEIKFVMVDVGQGDAFLIIDKKYDKTILVDTGGKFYQSEYELPLSEKNILPYLKEEGIRHIDLLVISHMDHDHMGEAAYINQKVNINHVYVNPEDVKFETDYILDNFKNSKIIYSNQTKNIDVGRIHIQNLNINQNLDNSNDQSIVLQINMMQYNILMLGDLSKEYESSVLEQSSKTEFDIVKIGHHGSDTSTSEELLKNNFKYALISSGVNNRYNHPDQSVLNSLNKAEKRILNTQETGMVIFTFDSQGYCVKSKLNTQINYCTKKELIN